MAEAYAYNGTISVSFEIDRGIRQGDPHFPHLFIIVVELLALAIRSCSEIGMQRKRSPFSHVMKLLSLEKKLN